MILEMSPQIRDNNHIFYKIEHQVMEVTMNGTTDVFDFRDLPDGELQIYDESGKTLIDTSLPEIPIMEAKKENGVLTVRFIFSIDINEQDERLLFPKPMSVDEFNDLMAELAELAERGKVEEDESVDDVEEDSDDSLEETDDLVEPDEVIDDDIIVEDERVDEEELVHKNDYIIDLEEVDF